MTSRLRRSAGAFLAGALTVGILGITPLAQAAVTGAVSGTVTDSHGALEYVSVDAYTLQDGAWTFYDGTATDAEGHYALDLAVGTYRLGFNDYDNHVEEYWVDAPTVEAADSIEVTDSNGVTADATLAELAHVVGTVTDASDDGLAGVDVWASRKVADGWDFVANATTDGDGQYSLDGLEAGTYRVEFEAGTSEAPLYEAWNNKGTFEDGDDIAVALDTTVADIDAQLVAGEFDPVPFTLVTEPALSGVQQVGNTLTVTTGTWSPTPERIDVFWFRGDDYTGVSGQSYALTDADAGKVLTVLVQAYGYEGQYEYANATTGTIAPAPAPAPAPPRPRSSPRPRPLRPRRHRPPPRRSRSRSPWTSRARSRSARR